MNAARQRAILAAQKIRRVDDPKPTPERPKLTPDERRAMYAPKSALEIIPKRPAMPLRVLKGSLKLTAWLFAMITAISGGILLGESKTGFRS